MLVFFNDPATTEIYTYLHTLSLHDALPIWRRRAAPASSNTRGHCRGTAAGRYKGRRPPYSRIPWPPGRPRSAPGSAAPPRPWTDRWYPTCRSEEHTSELQSLMRISYAVFCLKKKKKQNITKKKKTIHQHNTRSPI